MYLGEDRGTQNVPIWERETLGRFVASSERLASGEGLHLTFRIALSRTVCRPSGSGLAGVDAADLVSGHLEAPEGGHLSRCRCGIGQGDRAHLLHARRSCGRAQKISRSIRSRSGRGLPSLVNVASVVSVARSVPVAVVDGGNEAGRDGFEGSRKVMGSPPWSCGRMASGARSRRGG